MAMREGWGGLTIALMMLAGPALSETLCMDAHTGSNAIKYQRAHMEPPLIVVFVPPDKVAATLKRMNEGDARFQLTGDSALMLLSKSGAAAMFVQHGNEICRVIDPDAKEVPMPEAKRGLEG